MKKHYLRLIRFAIACALGIFALFLVAEFAARVWITFSPPWLDYQAYLLSRPNAYAQSAYWSPEFIKETTQIRWDMSEEGFLIPADLHLKWHNVDNGNRRTIDQPAIFKHTVYVVGNSTIFNNEVPDELTVPSLIQGLLNKKYGTTYRVLNLGVYSALVSEQFTRLKTLPLAPGDIVVFYDGLMEAQKIYLDFRKRHENQVEYYDYRLSQHFASLALYQIFRRPVFKYYAPTEIYNPVELNVAIQNMQNTYHAELLAVQQYIYAAHAEFFHFLQPQIWSAPLSPYEQSLTDNPEITPHGISEIFIEAWPALEAVTADVHLSSVSLTHILDQLRAQGVAVYIDYAHVNEIGNKVIAEAIVNTMNVF